MENGWETREKSKLISFVCQLMEQEFERLRLVAQVTTGWVVNQDIDLAALCAKLDERAVATFKREGNGDPTSPMLDQVVSYLLNQVTQLMNEPSTKGQPQPVQDMILRERANFHLRVNTLRVYAVLLLDEVDQNTQKICQAFEAWIISSVKSENAVASNVVKQVRQAVSGDQTYMDTIRVQDPEILSSIDRVVLQEDVPMYLMQSQQETPRGLTETRLDIPTLRHLYNQFKSNANEDLLDVQSFLTLVIENYQGYRFPELWRTFSFTTILNLVKKFAAEPLQNETPDSHNPFTSFEGKTSEFVNWRKIFVLFALASSSLPPDEKLDEMHKEMKCSGETVSLSAFQEVSPFPDPMAVD